jgi:hypothetical protein
MYAQPISPTWFNDTNNAVERLYIIKSTVFRDKTLRSLVANLPTFWKNVLHPSSGYKSNNRRQQFTTMNENLTSHHRIFSTILLLPPS